MFIRPILRGKDIREYSYNFAKKYIIAIPCGFTNKNAVGSPTNWFKTNYSSIYNYLVSTEEALSKNRKSKTKGLYKRDDQGEYWWELRSCKYMDDFSKQKIMYGEIVQYPRFYLDEKGEYYPEATTFIMTGDNLVPILLLLNSKITFYIFKTFYAGGGLRSSGIRYKKAFLNNLKLPILNKNDIDFFYDRYLLIKKKGFDNIEKELIEIDKYISKMYGFSLEEYQYIIKSC